MFALTDPDALTLEAVRVAVAAADPLIVGYGGGLNTVAGLILLHRAGGLVPDLISFADTGGEKPATYAYLDVMNGWLRAKGWPEITVVRKASPRVGDATLEEECLRRETMPSRAFGLSSCAMRWKVEPQEKFLNHWQPAKDCWARGRKPVKILGYDGGEQRRAKIHEDAKLRYWYPLLEADIDRDGCTSLVQSEGLPLPPKSACFYCPSSTKAEVVTLRRDHPDLFARAVNIERVALNSAKHELVSVRGLGRHWSWDALIAMTETERARQLEQPVESCTVCVEEDRNAP